MFFPDNVGDKSFRGTYAWHLRVAPRGCFLSSVVCRYITLFLTRSTVAGEFSLYDVRGFDGLGRHQLFDPCISFSYRTRVDFWIICSEFQLSPHRMSLGGVGGEARGSLSDVPVKIPVIWDELSPTYQQIFSSLFYFDWRISLSRL